MLVRGDVVVKTERGCVAMMPTITQTDLAFVCCHEEVDYRRHLRGSITEVNELEPMDGVDLSLWLFNKPFTLIHILHVGHL